jgi:hypothetical protein
MRSWSVLRLTHRIIYLLPKTLVVKTGRRILMGGSSRRGSLGADIINTSLGYFDLITPRIITVIVR